MSALVGLRAELPADALPAARAAVPELQAALGAGADVLVGQVDDDRAHLWLLAPEGEPAEAHARCEQLLDGARVTSFAGSLLSDDGAADVRTPHAVPIPSAVPEGELQEIDDWYVEEHGPLLLAVDGWMRIRRYALSDARGEPWNRLVLHDLAAPEVIKDRGVLDSMQTPRRRSFAPRAWFMAGGRAVLERV